MSRNVGNAVTRNLVRRRLRALFSSALKDSSEMFCVALVTVLPQAPDRTYDELEEQVSVLIKKIEKSKDLPR